MSKVVSFTIGNDDYTFTEDDLVSGVNPCILHNAETSIVVREGGELACEYTYDNECPYYEGVYELVDGNTITIFFGDNNERTIVMFNSEYDCSLSCDYGNGEIEIGSLAVSELCDMLGVNEYREIGYLYEDAVEEFMKSNPTYVYYIDNMRGFANEWELHIFDHEPTEQEKGKMEEVDADRVKHLLYSAVMTPKDYEGAFGASQNCVAILHY